MTMPEGPGSMLRETASRAVGRAVDSHERLRRCADRSAETTHVYLATWSAFHEAGLSAVLQLNDAFLRASQAAIEVALRGTPLARPERPRRLWPEASLKLSAGGTELLPGAPHPTTSDDSPNLVDWMESALRFPEPLGNLFTELDEPEDRRDQDR